MAGESPGKSEQQKSSGETGPDERDTRTAAPGEAEADGAGVAEANTDAGAAADADAETDAEAAITGSGTPAVTPGDAKDPRNPKDTGRAAPPDEARGEERDERAESAAPEAREADEADGGAKPEGAPGTTVEAGAAPAVAVPAADTDTEADSDADTAVAGEAVAGEAGKAREGAGKAATSDSGSEGRERTAGTAGTAGDAADAVSATPASGSDTGEVAADATSEDGPAGAEAEGGPTDSGSDAASAAATTAGTGAATTAGTGAATTAGTGAATTAGTGAATTAGTGAATTAGTGTGAVTGTGTGAGAEDDGASDGGSEGDDSASDGGSEGDDGSEREGEADGPAPGPGRGAVGGVPAQPSGKDVPAGPVRGARPGSGGGAGGAAASARTPGWAKGGVDQPTTAIRTVPAQGKPPVDHPTTALKLPARPPLNGGPGAPPAAGGSTFVPLKRDDAPSTAPSPWPSIPTPAAPGPSGAPGAPRAAGAPGRPITPVIDPERTTQQPVPPKDPLDLLAELTNTPDTPVRVVARRFKIWTPLVLLLVIVYVVVQAVRPLPSPSLTMTAAATYSFEGKSPRLPWPSEGQGFLAAPGLGTMDSFGKETPVPVGSVAKLMTAYLVLKDHPLKTGQNGPSITVDKLAEQEGGLDSEGESTLNTVKAGDKLTLKDALSALMVQSANNIARLLARWDAGSEAAFVKKMNAETKALGMDHTTYTDPSGLKSSTVSTAKDQVVLGQKLVGIPALTAITVLPSWTDPSGESHANYNRLVPYNGAIGLKTGTTTAAGGNLVFAAHKMVDGKDQLIVGAVFAQHKTPIIDTVNAVSKTAMIAAENVLKRVTVVHKGQVVGEVDDGLGGTTPVVATADAKAVGWGGLTERLQLSAGSGVLPHTAKAGATVGTLTVGNGLSSTKIPVALQKDLVEPGFGAKLAHF
ncbi:D-alanyl-D-alanine carboxypeptidase family protein [Streptomyces sp. NBC_01497]|uniref:D-alanyl-D-alanine carboxypeptidase family protein n=1 Tax=Streptomyces sp. NBC_01497 TaxID=2903885 RepID=UPI002E381D0F|nr:serine hydrolase [Streptomyces sp. NBC_01497]